MRHQRAGNGQALALAAAEIAPGGLHRFIQPFGLAAHKVRRLGNLQGLPDLLIGGIGAGPLHVVPDGAGKQHGALRHNADHLAQLGKAVLLHGMAKQFNAAAGAVIKAGNQVDQVDLPLPVPPITPMVWPFWAAKLMSVRLGAPAPW